MTDSLTANYYIAFDHETHTYHVIADDGFGVQVQARTQIGTALMLIEQLRAGTLKAGVQSIVSTYLPETVQ